MKIELRIQHYHRWTHGRTHRRTEWLPELLVRAKKYYEDENVKWIAQMYCTNRKLNSIHSFYLEKVVDLTIYHVDENEGQYVLEENCQNCIAAHMRKIRCLQHQEKILVFTNITNINRVTWIFGPSEFFPPHLRQSSPPDKHWCLSSQQEEETRS